MGRFKMGDTRPAAVTGARPVSSPPERLPGPSNERSGRNDRFCSADRAPPEDLLLPILLDAGCQILVQHRVLDGIVPLMDWCYPDTWHEPDSSTSVQRTRPGERALGSAQSRDYKLITIRSLARFRRFKDPRWGAGDFGRRLPTRQTVFICLPETSPTTSVACSTTSSTP